MFKKITKPKLIRNLFLVLLLGAGLTFYFSDRTPPELSSFELSRQSVKTSDPAPQFEFSGRLTDERGVTRAELQCLEDGEIKLLIYIAMAGADRNRVSFGEVSGSFGWAGRWSGTAYDLEFEGLGKLPPQIAPISCQWHAKLRDLVGNEALFDTGLTLSVEN